MIDDKKDVLIIIENLIDQYIPDCRVYTALSGAEGLEIVKREQPDVIILDIVMPTMDGYIVCEKLKADETTKHIPVIMLSGIKTDTASRIKGLKSGADAFLSKPIDPGELSVQVNVMLRIKEAEDKLRTDKVNLEQLVQEKTKELQIEITWHKKIAEALKDSESELRSLFKAMTDYIIEIDKDGHYISIAPTSQNFSNKPAKKLIGKTLHEIFPKERAGHLLEATRRCIDKHKIVNIDYSLIIKDKELWFEGTLSPKTQNTILFIARDITERKQTENALRENEEKYRSLIESSEDPIYLINRDLKYIYANKKFLSRLRKSESQVFEHGYAEFHSLAKVKLFSEKIKEVFKSRKPIFYEYHSERDGNYFFRTLSPIMNPETGEVNAVTVISKDITEIKQAEKQMLMANERLQHLLYSSSTIIYSCETSGDYGVTFISDNVFILTGYLSFNFIKNPKFWINHIHPEDRECVLEKMLTILKKGSLVIEYRFRKKDGAYIWLRDSKRMIINEKGQPLEIVGNLLDVTERKLTEEEARKMHQSLVEAHRKLKRAYRIRERS